MIDDVVEDLRSAWDFYKMCKKDPDAGATGAKADARQWLEESLQNFFEAYDKECS